MKAYKGFRKDDDGRIYCQPITNKFYYEEGNTYELPKGEEPKLCHYGFHACTFPMDVFSYYNKKHRNAEFHEVELEDVSEECGSDSKVAGRKITIGRELTEDEMFDISVKMMLGDKEKYFNGEPCAPVSNGKKCNFIDRKGRLLSDEWFDYVEKFAEGFGTVCRAAKYNFINKDGKLLSDEWFDYSQKFVEGFGIVGRYGKYNFINKEGKILSDIWFVDVQLFYKGTAKVKINGKWKYIDTEGKIKDYEGLQGIL